MWKPIVGLILFGLAAPQPAAGAPAAVTAVASMTAHLAAPAPTGPLAAAAARETTRLAAATAARPARRVEPAEQHSWISRHPALFGAMVGAGAGAVAAGTMDNELFCSGGDDDCVFHGEGRTIVGAGIGAGIGAAIGVIVGLGRD